MILMWVLDSDHIFRWNQGGVLSHGRSSEGSRCPGGKRGFGGVIMSSFRIPLVWQMYGHVDVEADTLDDAIEYALGPDCPLPEGEYVDDSIQVDDLVLNQEATHESHQ